jgi:hypothetical protein
MWADKTFVFGSPGLLAPGLELLGPSALWITTRWHCSQQLSFHLVAAGCSLNLELRIAEVAKKADQNRELAGDTDAAANVKMPSRNEPVASAEEAKALIQSQRSCRL